MLPKQLSQSQIDTGPLAYQQQQQETSSNIDNIEPLELTNDDNHDDNTIIPIDRCTLSETNSKMQTSSVHSLVSGEYSNTMDLATENLPAVDTPDACDKAALRYHTHSFEKYTIPFLIYIKPY